MDKELLRVVIILIGLLVMIAMVLWHFFKSLRERRDSDEYLDDADYEADDEFENGDDVYDAFPFEADVDGDALLDDDDIKP
ncbi:MAG: cell division protein FtsZ, partial [Methylomonas sp.]|nr:cell division protein FtsZ [Methylomonas sp.]